MNLIGGDPYRHSAIHPLAWLSSAWLPPHTELTAQDECSPVTSPGTGFTALYMTPTLPHRHRALTLRRSHPSRLSHHRPGTLRTTRQLASTRRDEKRTCAIWFDDELAHLTALRAVMCLGQIAWTSTLAAARRLGWQVPRPAPRFGHGTRTQLVQPDGSIIVVLGCYHVSRQNTNTGRLTRSMLDDAVNTLRDLATT